MRRVSVATRDELLGAVVRRYTEARRFEKGASCEFVEVTGYHRKHAARLCAVGAGATGHGRDRSDACTAFGTALIVLSDSRRRLKPLIPIAPRASGAGRGVRGRLETVSAATIDRTLCPVRKQAAGCGRRRTAPSPAIRRAVPIRTYADRDDPRSEGGGSMRRPARPASSFRAACRSCARPLPGQPDPNGPAATEGLAWGTPEVSGAERERCRRRERRGRSQTRRSAD